jgi:hypothetical protein
MSAIDATLLQPRWAASELRKLSREQRDAILEAAAAKAEDEYKRSTELSDFDAFGPEDLHGGRFSAR